MPEVRLECVDRFGGHIGELTDAVLDSVKWELNQPGEVNYSLKQTSKQINMPQENVNEVQVWVESVDPTKPIHWAIHQRANENPRTVKFSCPGLLEYFDHRYVLNATLTYTTIDQLSIGAAIINDMQSGAGQSFNIGVGSFSASGVVRSREYKREEHPRASDMLSEFPNLTDALGNPTGFDYEIVISSNTRFWTPYYPTKGSVLTKPVLEYGKNMTDFDVSRDGQEMANRIYATGGTNGDVKFEQSYQDAASTTTYGEWQDVKSFGSEKDVTVLLERARKEVFARKVPIVLPSVTVVEIPDALLGVIKTGDWVPVAIDCGRTQIASNYRVRSIEWSPGPGNLKLELASS